MLGGFLKGVGDLLGKAPPAPEFVVPDALPAVKLPAAELAAKAGVALPPGVPPSSGAAPLLRDLLNEKQDMVGATKLLANGLPPKSSAGWAAESAKLVEGKLSGAELKALQAAEAMNAAPSPATRTAALAAADAAGLQGPGSLAAQAAAFQPVPGAPPLPGAETLLPTCVAGAVIASAALSPPVAPKMPEPPEMPKAKLPELPAGVKPPPPPAPAVPPPPKSPAMNRNANAFQPFLEKGIARAAS